MKYPNIEKSAFRPSEYVGYRDGAWRITRANGGWQALHKLGKHGRISAPTLREVSRQLELVAV